VTTEGIWIPSEWESGVRGLLEADFQVGLVQDDGELVNWVIMVNRWPSDAELRRSLLSGVWADIPALVASIYTQQCSMGMELESRRIAS
jgi:hypothetical protein